jgi:hypothetical protein
MYVSTLYGNTTPLGLSKEHFKNVLERICSANGILFKFYEEANP